MTETLHKSELILAYQNGATIAALMRQFGLSRYLTLQLLKSNNIPIKAGRSHNGRNLILDQSEIETLYASGLSTYQIAKLKNCSDEAIRKRIRKLRSASERNKHDAACKTKIANSCRKKWKDPEYKEKVRVGTSTPEYKAMLSEIGKRNAAVMVAWSKSEEGRQFVSLCSKKLWKTAEYYEKQSVHFGERAQTLTEGFKRTISDPVRRKEWLTKIQASSVAKRENQPRISHTQQQLYYILRSSNILFFEEGHNTKVGPFYVVDCIIPKQQDMQRDLVIEVQGEYWHSLPRVRIKDQQKETYIAKHTDYDLLHLEELDLSCWSEVEAKLVSYGLRLKTVNCAVYDLAVAQTTEQDARTFFSIFHYSSSIRKGAKTFSAKLSDQIIAAISYTYPIRSQIASSRGLELKEVQEISRLARVTNINCPNLLSWFIHKTIKLLPKSVRLVIAFSDSTYGHIGGVYNACNFQNDGVVEPDYWYNSINGRYHKRTIWGRAKQFNMTEQEYANQHNLARQYGGEKTRWLYWVK